MKIVVQYKLDQALGFNDHPDNARNNTTHRYAAESGEQVPQLCNERNFFDAGQGWQCTDQKPKPERQPPAEQVARPEAAKPSQQAVKNNRIDVRA